MRCQACQRPSRRPGAERGHQRWQSV